MAQIIKNKKQFKRILQANLVGYMFIFPLILGLAIFTFYPMLQSLIYSFYDYSGFGRSVFTGLGNYITLLRDEEFLKVMGNTAIYTVISVPMSIVLSYLLAVFVNKKLKGMSAFRVIYYLPVVIPGIVSGVLWMDFYGYPDGVFNTILKALGMESFTFFSVARTSMFSVILMGVWGIGGGMILWLAALKNIPASLYEAAEIDGAGKLVCFFIITIPMSTPMIFYNLITGVIGGLQFNGTLIYAPRNGTGIDNSIYFIAVKIYKTAFENQSIGLASAEGWVLMVIIACIVGVLFSTSRWVFLGDD